MNAQFAYMNAKFKDMRISQSNSYATMDSDPILAKTQLLAPVPGLPLVIPEPVPAGFPETRGALYSLHNVQLDVFLSYYGLSKAGSVVDKRRALANYLGLPR